MDNKFLTFFPGHAYRYIDSTGQGRPPQVCAEKNDSLNLKGYESYFTVNGFGKSPTAQKDQCTNLNSFFVDIDGRKDQAELELIKSKLDPTFIIETKNGWHIYWVLDEPIYKEEISPEEWDSSVAKWEKIEQSIVTTLNADPVVKDLTRILRVPDTYYWKKTGDQWEKGTEGVFKVKGIYKQTANMYSMKEVEEVFPIAESLSPLGEVNKPLNERAKELAKAEQDNFFKLVNEEFPLEERDSFIKLTNADPNSLPLPNIRNKALHLTSCLMRQAGWNKEKAKEQIAKVGWHGMEKETGGLLEIDNAIESAYKTKHTYSYKNEIIVYNTSPVETQRLHQAHSVVTKGRKEQDKIRYSNYERELLAQNPYLKKNEIGIVFNYRDGVYKMMSDQEVSDMVLVGLYEDCLWGYRTKKHVSDKVACLISVIPLLVVTDDKGYLVNVKNGILDIYSDTLIPHTPDFVSLIQYPVEYDATATCPVWEACIEDWTSGGEEQVEKALLLQQFTGYCLSSSMLYDRALFMVGDGGNGKSTFVDTISMVIGGDATSHIDLESLYGTFGMHGLIGKRLNVIEEVSGNYYQSNKLKKVVSGEPVTIDIKYKPQFTFRPQTKFVFSVNQLPRVDDTSSATERRILAIQFLNNYRDNPNFKLRSSVGLLAKELSGILNWMIDGAKILARDGKFITTNEQTKMLDEYREENSSVEGFLSQCVMKAPGFDITTSALYYEYKRWSATDGGRKVKANITFTKEVRNYGAKDNRFGYEPRRFGGTEAKFTGVALTPQWKAQTEGGLTNY